MKARNFRARLHESRSKRGISLLEAVLYLSIAASTIALTASIMKTESRRQEDISTAATMSLMISSAQRYVAAEYDTIREQLLAGARANGAAEMALTMQNLSDMGYIPPAYAVNDTNLFNQQYRLLLRAVSVSDTNIPQATMTEAAIDADGDGLIDNHLIDFNNANDEMTIEALLVTTGGDPVPAHRGPQIVVRTEKPTAGFVGEDGTESAGAYGSFVFDISGFESFEDYPGPGHFANIIALSRFSTIDTGGFNAGGGVPDPLQRCVEILEIPGQSPGTALYQNCLAGNGMYGEIVFNSYDSNGDGLIDKTPGLGNVPDIDMSAPIDLDGDGFPDNFPAIRGVYDIEMGAPSDMDGDGFPDVFSEISGLARIACGTGGGTAISGTLVIDCNNIVLDGNLLATGDGTIGGDMTADRFISSEMGGQDLSEGIYNALLLSSGETIAKPTCPTTSADGMYLMEPRVFVVPAAYSHPGGLPTVGVRAYAEDTGAGSWRVRLFNFVDEDRCTSSISSPLTTETNDFRTENASKCTTSDGLADVYEVSESAGRVLAMTRCY